MPEERTFSVGDRVAVISPIDASTNGMPYWFGKIVPEPTTGNPSCGCWGGVNGGCYYVEYDPRCPAMKDEGKSSIGLWARRKLVHID